MKLKSDEVFWPQLSDETGDRFEQLSGDRACDVAIVGGGITGALAAYHFIRAGVSTLLIDCRQPGHGSTAASTGLLQYEIDTSLVELAGLIGRDNASAAYRASVEAVKAFEPLVAEIGDNCGLIRRHSAYLASRGPDVDDLRLESEARRSIGIDVEYLDHSAVRERCNLSRPAALWSSCAYEVDPFRLCRSLIRWSAKRGLEVAGESEIVGRETRAQGVTLKTSYGARIKARKVVVATGYETTPEIPRGLFKLLSTYAMVSDPIPGFQAWPGQFLIWESARPYLYLRTTADNRIIVGGEDVDLVDPQKRDAMVPAKARQLGDRFAGLFPEIDIQCSCAWGGTFAQTQDGLPYIGTLAQFPHAYFALGYGGNGITFSLLAARIIVAAFLGSADKDAHLFRFDR